MTRPTAFCRTSRLGASILSTLLATGLAAGCSTTTAEKPATPKSPPAEHTPGQIGVVTVSEGIRIVHDDWAKLGYRWQWSTMPLAAGRGRVEFFDILGDTVAVQSTDAWTSLVQTSTGNRLWQVRNASPLTRFIENIRIRDVLISATRSELFIMEHASGNLIARHPVDVVVSTRPAIFAGLAVFGTPTGEVLCHRFGNTRGEPLPPPFDSGRKEWGYLIDGSITADPVLIGQTAGLVTQAGEVFFVDIPTGSGVGRGRISGGMATSPVTDGRLMYAASLDQSIYAFSTQGGPWLWRYRTASPLRSQPTWHDGVLYCHVPDEGLIAFDVSEEAQASGRMGEQRWANPELRGSVIAVRSGRLVVWDGQNAAIVDPATGDVIASVVLPRFTRLQTSAFVDGDLFALADNGLLARFSPR